MQLPLPLPMLLLFSWLTCMLLLCCTVQQGATCGHCSAAADLTAWQKNVSSVAKAMGATKTYFVIANHTKTGEWLIVLMDV